MARASANSRRAPGRAGPDGVWPGARKRSGARRSRSRPARKAEGSAGSRPAAARSTRSSDRLVAEEDEAFAVTLVGISLEVAVEAVDLQARPAQADGHLVRLVEPHAL